MSVPMDRGPDPHADPLVAAVVRAAATETAAACPDAEVLGLYADRELRGDELGAVDAHVVTCTRCQATVAAFLRGAPNQDAPVAAAVTAAAPWWVGWRWLVPLASATAVLAVAVWLGRGPADRVTEQARVADTAPTAETTPAAAAAPGPRPSEAESRDGRADGSAGAAAQNTVANARSRPTPETGERLASRRQGATENALAAGKQEATPQPPAPGAPAAAPQMADAAAQSAPPMPAASAPAPARVAATSRERSEAAAGAPAAMAQAVAERTGAAVGAAAAKAADLSTVSGTVTYRARMALPAGAVVDVRLLDVSRADAPAVTLARAEIITRGQQVPLPFTLRYDASAVQAGRRYAVQATITVDGRITWRTTTPHPVLVDGVASAEPLTVVVDAVR